ncbi:MAG TPA: Dabb family protein [Paludibaculum sp.]|jgi:hypothetical protein
MTRTFKMTMAAAALVALGAGIGVAANRFGKPTTIIHVVTLFYKDGTTEAQKKAVLDGVEKMAGEVPGIRNIWLKGIKAQVSAVIKDADGKLAEKRMTDAIVMEFESEAAFKAYDDHPAHREWEKIYTVVRGQSRTTDITN